MTRVLHVNRTASVPGGGEVYVRELVARQRAAGHDARLVGIGRTVPRSAGILSGLRRRAETLAAIAHHRPDVVHLHGVYGTLSPVVLRALRRRWACVVTLHSAAPLCFHDTKVVRGTGRICEQPLGAGCVTSGCHRPFRNGAVRGAYDGLMRVWQWHELARASAVVVSSEFFRRQALAGGVPPDRVHLVPLFSRWTPPASVAPRGVPSVLFVGRLSREKGPHVLVTALSRLTSRPWTATLVGDGPEAPRLRELIAAAGLADRVTLRPRTDGHDLASVYRAARVVVVPSLVPEGFSLVGIEAMAFGRPVIASAAGGTTDWCADGETGLLVSPADVTALGGAIARLLDDADLAARLGAAGARHVTERFSGAGHLAGLDAVYERVRTNDARRAPDALAERVAV